MSWVKKIEELGAELKKAGLKVKAETKEGLQELKEKLATLKEEMEKQEAGKNGKRQSRKYRPLETNRRGIQ